MTQDLEKIKKDLKKNQKSLTSKMSDLKYKIANMKKFKNSVILCDTSGSMDSLVNGEARAIDLVDAVLENFKGAQLYEFNSNCNKVQKLGRPRGGTNMAGAFYKVNADGAKEIILLTDGAPDSEQHALEAAKVTNLKINIIYIGPQPTPKFLERLANVNGGIFTSVELITANATKELENKIRGLLT